MGVNQQTEYIPNVYANVVDTRAIPNDSLEFVPLCKCEFTQ